MKCKYCNGELEENSRFCGFCGGRLDEDADATVILNRNEDAFEPAPITYGEEQDAVSEIDDGDLAAYYPEDTEGAPSVEDAKAKSKKKVKKLIILLVILTVAPALLIGIIIICILAYFLLNGGLDDPMELFDLNKNEISFEVNNDYDNDNDNDNEDYYSQWTDTIDYDEDEFLYNEYYEDTPDTTYVEETTVVETTPVVEETTVPEVPETTYDDGRRVVIANGGLRIRNAPNLSGGIVGLIPNGTIINVERFENNWAYTCIDGVYGWCSCDYLFVPYEHIGTPIYMATVNSSSGVEIVSDQYVDADVLHTLVPNGDTLYVYTIDGDRAYVRYNNIYGWCPTECLELSEIR